MPPTATLDACEQCIMWTRSYYAAAVPLCPPVGARITRQSLFGPAHRVANALSHGGVQALTRWSELLPTAHDTASVAANGPVCMVFSRVESFSISGSRWPLWRSPSIHSLVLRHGVALVALHEASKGRWKPCSQWCTPAELVRRGRARRTEAAVQGAPSAGSASKSSCGGRRG